MKHEVFLRKSSHFISAIASVHETYQFTIASIILGYFVKKKNVVKYM